MSYAVRTFDQATLVNVVDGDTCDLLVDLGFSVKMKIRFRLIGIDTPEKGQPGWKEASDFLRTYLDKPVLIQSTKLDKYGRFLAEIYPVGFVVPVSLNQMLLDNNLAVVYKEKSKS